MVRVHNKFQAKDYVGGCGNGPEWLPHCGEGGKEVSSVIAAALKQLCKWLLISRLTQSS